METNIKLKDVTIRTKLQPGDIGFIIHLHGKLYSEEYGYGVAFESYVAKGFHEFIANHKSGKDGVWVCEHNHRIIGFLLLMDRGNNSAQLRFFIMEPGYRGMGLGKKLIDEFMKLLKTNGYKHAYLWTTHEQHAAANLYLKRGFVLTEEKESTSFGKSLKEQRYDLYM
jgi:peptidyl-dipeptidase Dcp